jgi:hypothetical protein
MPGNSRMRHCDACGRDVINAASLTPEQIEEHIRAGLDGKSMPCMRLVQFEDGSLLTARTERGLSLIQRAVAGVSAFAVMAASAVAQSNAPVMTTLRGRVVDAAGAGVGGATVKLHSRNHPDSVAKSAVDGTFVVVAISGEYGLEARGPKSGYFVSDYVFLHTGEQKLSDPLRLTREVTVTVADVVVVDRESATVKTENPKWEPTLH